MTPIDSPLRAAQRQTNPAPDRENSPIVPVPATAGNYPTGPEAGGPDAGAPQAGPTRAARSLADRAAEAALDAAADAFLIHRAVFAPDNRAAARGREVSRARMAAIEAVIDAGLATPWDAGKAFGLDLSTVKHALRRAPELAAADPDYAAGRARVHAATARWAQLEAGA
jgi:hypothetical protein